MIKKYILFLIFFSFLTAQTLENNKSKYLQGLLNLLKNNVESVLPIKTKIGIINNVKIENNTLIITIPGKNLWENTTYLFLTPYSHLAPTSSAYYPKIIDQNTKYLVGLKNYIKGSYSSLVNDNYQKCYVGDDTTCVLGEYNFLENNTIIFFDWRGLFEYMTPEAPYKKLILYNILSKMANEPISILFRKITPEGYEPIKNSLVIFKDPNTGKVLLVDKTNKYGILKVKLTPSKYDIDVTYKSKVYHLTNITLKYGGIDVEI